MRSYPVDQQGIVRALDGRNSVPTYNETVGFNAKMFPMLSSEIRRLLRENVQAVGYPNACSNNDCTPRQAILEMLA